MQSFCRIEHENIFAVGTLLSNWHEPRFKNPFKDRYCKYTVCTYFSQLVSWKAAQGLPIGLQYYSVSFIYIAKKHKSKASKRLAVYIVYNIDTPLILPSVWISKICQETGKTKQQRRDFTYRVGRPCDLPSTLKTWKEDRLHTHTQTQGYHSHRGSRDERWCRVSWRTNIRIQDMWTETQTLEESTSKLRIKLDGKIQYKQMFYTKYTYLLLLKVGKDGENTLAS